jgi:hypothetical protein
MNKKTSIQGVTLAVLLAIAGTVWYRDASSAGASDREEPSGAYKPMNVDNPRIHWDRLTGQHDDDIQSTGRDIFNWKLPPPPPAPVVRAPEPVEVAPPPPPPPPPPQLPLKLFGFGGDPKGSAHRAFLSDGSDVFIVGEGDTLLGRFRVVKIMATSIEFEEISSGRRAFKPLEDQPPGS